jgi:flagellin-like protein
MNHRGASSAVGTVLMVAVALVLAAAVGAFAFDLGESAEEPGPQAAFQYDWEKSSRTLEITIAAGDDFTAANTDRLEVVIYDEDETGGNDYDVARGDWANANAGGFPVTAGDTFVVTGESGGGDLDVEQAGTDVSNPGSETHEPEIDDVVQIVWHGPGDQTYVVAEYVITSGED